MMNNSPNLQKVEYENIKENDYNLIANRYAQPTVNNNVTARTKWEMVKLGDVCQILDNKRKPVNGEIRASMKGEVPYYGANGIIDYINDYIFDEKLLLIAEDGGYWAAKQQTCYLIDGKSWVNNHAHVLKFEQDIVRKFVCYALNETDIIKYITGSTRGKLTLTELKNIQIPLPPIETQQKIVEELEKIEETIEHLEQAIKGLKKQLNLDSFRFAKYFESDDCD